MTAVSRTAVSKNGKANIALFKMLVKHGRIPKTSPSISASRKGRYKTLFVNSLDADVFVRNIK